MKEEFYRVLERVADLFVGNFAVSFQNELRFMVRAPCSIVRDTI